MTLKEQYEKTKLKVNLAKLEVKENVLNYINDFLEKNNYNTEGWQVSELYFGVIHFIKEKIKLSLLLNYDKEGGIGSRKIKGINISISSSNVYLFSEESSYPKIWDFCRELLKKYGEEAQNKSYENELKKLEEELQDLESLYYGEF